MTEEEILSREVTCGLVDGGNCESTMEMPHTAADCEARK